jgi:Ca2+-binding EF-hand superfamily protein
LPGLVGERFFALASSPSKDRRVDLEFFQRLILDVYSKSNDEKARLAFRIYDFNSDGRITPDDVMIILNHLPTNTQDSNSSDSSIGGHSFDSHSADYRTLTSSQRL